jgi:hypothetical protein
VPIPGLKTHAPSGAAPWPLVLLEGDEGAGKSWTLAEFSRSERVAEMYWIPLGESGVAEQYGAIPGAAYEVVELETGDYIEVLAVVRKIKEYAQARREAGERKPVVLAIDSVSGVWEGLKDWTNQRARESERGKAILRKDPHAEVKPTRNLWNDANARWHTLQAELKTFPGIVIVTARGKDVSATDPQTGQPMVGVNNLPIKEWSPEINRELPYAVDVRIRMRREGGAEVVFVRSVLHGRKPGEDEKPEPITAKEADGRLLEWLLFDTLAVDPETAFVAEYRDFSSGELTEDERTRPEEPESDNSRNGRRQAAQRRNRTKKEWVEAIAGCTDLDCTRALWWEAQRAGLLAADVEGIDLGDRIRARAEDIEAGKVRPPEAAPPAAQGGSGTASPEAVGGPSDPLAVASGEEPEANPEADPKVQPLRVPDPVGPEKEDRPDGKDEEEPQGAAAPSQPAQEPPAVEQAPDTDVRPGKLRQATLAALSELYGGDDVAMAAIEDEFGKPYGMVGNRRLRELLAKEQRQAASA